MNTPGMKPPLLSDPYSRTRLLLSGLTGWTWAVSTGGLGLSAQRETGAPGRLAHRYSHKTTIGSTFNNYLYIYKPKDDVIANWRSLSESTSSFSLLSRASLPDGSFQLIQIRRRLRNRPSTPMIQGAYPPLRAFPTTRWIGTFPIRHYAFRGQLASIPPMRPISFSSVNMGRPRPRASDFYRRPSVTLRVEGRNRGIPVGQIVGYASLMVVGKVFRPLLSPFSDEVKLRFQVTWYIADICNSNQSPMVGGRW